jgi:hypothetical protein
MMITRAFLLLLAMMTGLSAAQAAEAVRPVRDSAGISASVIGQINPDQVRAAKSQNASRFASQVEDYVFQPAIVDSLDRIQALPADRVTYRSDRARE